MMWDVCRSGSGRTVAIVPGETRARILAAVLSYAARIASRNGWSHPFDYVRHGAGWIGTPPESLPVRMWNGAVARAWYAVGCPPRFPLRRIGGAR